MTTRLTVGEMTQADFDALPRREYDAVMWLLADVEAGRTSAASSLFDLTPAELEEYWQSLRRFFGD